LPGELTACGGHVGDGPLLPHWSNALSPQQYTTPPLIPHACRSPAVTFVHAEPFGDGTTTGVAAAKGIVETGASGSTGTTPSRSAPQHDS
jgi:hypothetical protein